MCGWCFCVVVWAVSGAPHTQHKNTKTHHPPAMKYLTLCAILILHGLHRAYSAFKPPPFLSFIGSVALVLIACYTFYPAFRNVEGDLGCTVTILAGSKNQQGKFQTVQLIDLTVRHKTIPYSQSQSIHDSLTQTIFYPWLYLHTMRPNAFHSCSMSLLNI